MREYRKAAIAKRIGERPQTIQFWVKQGLLEPDIEPRQGKGKALVFSERNLLEAAMIHIIKERQIVFLFTAREIMEGLRKGRYKNQVFKDFFDNPEWGETKELIFKKLDHIGAGGFSIIEKDNHGYYRPDPLIFGSSIKQGTLLTVVMLGKIKQLALKILEKEK